MLQINLFLNDIEAKIAKAFKGKRTWKEVILGVKDGQKKRKRN